MISFYRKYLPNVSQLSSSLSDLLRKEVKEPLHIAGENLERFNAIKILLTTAPVLKLPDMTKTFVLQTDASNDGLGAVLCQYYDNSPFPVAYASRKLLDRERKYSTIEKECLAIVFAIQKCKYYLLGKEFIIETDNGRLMRGRLMRGSLVLQPYRFRIVHISGRDNCKADSLSRL